MPSHSRALRDKLPATLMNAGEIHVWRVIGAAGEAWTRPALLAHALGHAPKIAVAEKGKPYLPDTPRVKFNLSHTRGMALIAVAMDVEVGVDVERLRPVPEWRLNARRFFAPEQAATVTTEREFFRQWTRLEAQLKALGVGLWGRRESYPSARPTIAEIDVGEEYAAAVAATAPGMLVKVH